MAKKTAKTDYPRPILETVPKVVGWIHRCEWCGEEFKAKKKIGPRYCPEPRYCRVEAHRDARAGRADG